MCYELVVFWLIELCADSERLITLSAERAFSVVAEFVGELHVPSIQRFSCHLLDLHIQEGS